MEHLVRRYLGGFGPATLKDVVSFTGLPATELTPALARLELRRFRSHDGEELLDIPRAPLPDPDTPAPARFLATWDASLLVHARRTGVLPEEHRPRIFHTKARSRSRPSSSTAPSHGTWRYAAVARTGLTPLDARRTPRARGRSGAARAATCSTERLARAERLVQAVRSGDAGRPPPACTARGRAPRVARGRRRRPLLHAVGGLAADRRARARGRHARCSSGARAAWSSPRRARRSSSTRR